MIWNEKDISVGYLDDVERFSSSRYLRMVRKQNSPNCLVKIVKTDNNNKKGLVSNSFNQDTVANLDTKDYIYFSYTKEIYKIKNKEFINDVLWIETVVPISEKLCSDNTEVISFIDKKYIELYRPEIFMIDYIRDRFAIFQFIAILSDINKNNFSESFLGLVKKLSGVYIFNDLLYYNNLIEYYNNANKNHSEEYMRKVFHFISDNMYFYTTDNNNITVGGTVLKDIYSISSRMNLSNYERLSGINTDLNIEYPEDWCHMNKITETGKTISLNTTTKIGIKKIFFQNCGLLDNNINYCFIITTL